MTLLLRALVGLLRLVLYPLGYVVGWVLIIAAVPIVAFAAAGFWIALFLQEFWLIVVMLVYFGGWLAVFLLALAVREGLKWAERRTGYEKPAVWPDGQA